MEIKSQGYPALKTGGALLFSPFLPSYSEVPFWYHTVLICSCTATMGVSCLYFGYVVKQQGRKKQILSGKSVKPEPCWCMS